MRLLGISSIEDCHGDIRWPRWALVKSVRVLCSQVLSRGVCQKVRELHEISLDRWSPSDVGGVSC